MRLRSLVSRTLAVLILLGAFFGCYRLVAAPIASAYDTAARSVERSQMLLARYRALAGQREELAARVAAREMLASEDAAYLDGANGALTAAALHDRVGSVVAQTGGELHSTEVLPSKAVENLPAVSRARLRLEFSIGVENLERLLYDLEIGDPYLFIEQITIRTQRKYDDHQQGILAVGLEIYGYGRGEPVIRPEDRPRPARRG